VERWACLFGPRSKGPVMGKRLVSGALIFALGIGFLLVTAGVAWGTASQESEFSSLINYERTHSGSSWSCGHSGGLNSLAYRSDLASVARQHSQDMANKGTIWHASGTPYKISGWTVYGENVGMGPMGVSDPVKNLHVAFMNSSEHCDNILYPSFNQVGVGVVVKDNTMYVTEIFVKRGSSSYTGSTSTSRHKSSTSTSSSSSNYSHSSSASSYSAPAAPKPKPKPKPRPKPVATSQTVDLLVRMAGMDADHVDPATGAAAGF
jgi:hypothetical protein